jgi:MHS family proline/betaine transporter-like MFS transporter
MQDAGGKPGAKLAGVVGNVLEWYDFAVFGFFAPLIAEQFFPAADRTASLLAAFGVFAGAYFMRPLGGVLFGQLGDRLGRKTALQLSVMMMALPTMCIGLLPTHARIGLAAPLLLVGLRLVQGLSVGGELVGSIAYLTESAAPGRRGATGSLALCSSTAGVLLGSMVAAALEAGLSPAALQSWGWRLPFLAGVAIGGVGLWMRWTLPETPAFERLRQRAGRSAHPVREVLRDHSPQVLHVTALVMLVGGGFYLLFVWWPTMLSRLLQPPVPHALLVNSVAMVVLMGAIPLGGVLSDWLGRRALMLFCAALLAVVAYPLFHLVDHGRLGSALLAQIVFAVLLGGATGPAPAAMVERFPTRLRYTGVALGYNLSLSLFGGTAPLVATWLVERSGEITAPAFYLVALALATAMAAYQLPAAGSRLAEVTPRAPARVLLFPPPPRRVVSPGARQGRIP